MAGLRRVKAKVKHKPRKARPSHPRAEAAPNSANNPAAKVLQHDLSGQEVAANVSVEHIVRESFHFTEQHFELTIGVDGLGKVRDKGPAEAFEALHKRVRPKRDVEAIPEGAKSRESAALVEKALTVALP